MLLAACGAMLQLVGGDIWRNDQKFVASPSIKDISWAEKTGQCLADQVEHAIVP